MDDEMRMLWDRADEDERHDRLLAEGWRLRATKAFVERDLGDAHLPADPPAGWMLRSLADVGEDAFAELMLRASTGDPFEEETEASALASLRELIDDAGETYDPQGWFVVADARGVLGVVLPQPYDDAPGMGTLFYVGVLPERRGEGLGAALHAFGLGRLGALGVHRYVGSTDLRNAPMLAVFARNGARQIRTQSFYVRDVTRAPTPGTETRSS